MAENPRQEQRKFVRVPTSFPVRYRFVSPEPGFRDEAVREGRTDNIGGGGLLLTGQVPSVDWITELLMENITLDIEIELPDGHKPAKAAARVAWLEAIDQNTEVCQLGLTFREITAENQERIFRYVEKNHEAGGKT
jgi:hypothetical protein